MGNNSLVASSRAERLYAPVEDTLLQVESLLRRELQHKDPRVDEMLHHARSLAGKRLRPTLLLLVAQSLGEIADSHVVLAAVVEIIHTATLVHDDVLDEAEVRRQRETINARWNNHASILLGDHLFALAYYLTSGLETTHAGREIGRTSQIVCAGELRQIRSAGQFDLTYDEYLRIIDAKTAELCACCCRLGAHYAGALPEQEQAFSRFGRNLGIAFQIVDDVLDFAGNEQEVGKTLGTDLAQLKPTLPLIQLRSSLSSAEMDDFHAALQLPLMKRKLTLCDMMKSHGVLPKCTAIADDFAEQARQELQVVPNCPARDALELWTQFAVERRR